MEDLVQALQSSGVAGVLVVVLGGLIRQWLTGVKEQLTTLSNKLERLETELSEAKRAREVRTVRVDHQLDAFGRRLEQLEARGAGA